MKSVERKRLVKKLDVIFSQYIRKRDGHCMRCGRLDGELQCAHIAGRRSLAGRWNEKNAITLCYACHLRWSHQNPLEFSEWLKETLPEFYEEGRKVIRTTVKNLDLEELLEKYKKKASDLLVGNKDLPF
jgi:5-methylcytosine-specific restriction endonuclease McrA